MPTPISPGQVKRIKTMQRALNLEDGDYRLMLWSVARVKSCKDLKGAAVGKVMTHLERCLGQIPPLETVQSSRFNVQSSRATAHQVAKIEALWGQVSRAPELERAAALRSFLIRRFKLVGEWLTEADAARVIEGLKQMARRAA
jgi:hypothetical protein